MDKNVCACCKCACALHVLPKMCVLSNMRRIIRMGEFNIVCFCMCYPNWRRPRWCALQVLSGWEESILIGCNPIDSHGAIDSYGVTDSYGAIDSNGAVMECMIIVCAPYYYIPYVLYCSGDAVATMYSYDMLLFLDLR
jgi:hypothetical protein